MDKIFKEMKYVHNWNKDLICDVFSYPIKGKNYYEFELNGKKLRANKDIFEREWKPKN